MGSKVRRCLLKCSQVNVESSKEWLLNLVVTEKRSGRQGNRVEDVSKFIQKASSVQTAWEKTLPFDPTWQIAGCPGPEAVKQQMSDVKQDFLALAQHRTLCRQCDLCWSPSPRENIDSNQFPTLV